MSELRLEVSDRYISDGATFTLPGGASLMITPAINENYWIFRVKLHGDQAIVGFPKFGTIGIGFAQETDWNTNLPYTCESETIYNHIKHNRHYDEITDEQCFEAIRMIQQAATKYQQSLKLESI